MDIKRINQLDKLQRKMNKSVNVFTKAIEDLEETNREYHVLQGEICEEIDILTQTKGEVANKIEENNSLLKNLKNLLTGK